MNAFEDEPLREALLALQKSKAKEQKLLDENRAILASLSSMTGASNKQQIFNGLLTALRKYINFKDAIVLSRSIGENTFQTLLSTNEGFCNLEWQPDEKLNRAMLGESIIIYKPESMPQFNRFDAILQGQVKSVLMTGVESEASQSVILFIGTRKGQFELPCKEILAGLIPLIERAVIDIDYKEKLQSLVATRTSELRQNRERFRDFVNSVGDCLWETDSSYRINYVSEVSSEKASFYGKKIQTILEGESVCHQLVIAMDARQPIRDLEWRYNADKGIWLSISGAPFYDLDGRFLGYRGTVKDISQSKLRYLELKRARSEAEKANQAKSQFLATMSHEIRTPLNAILGLIDVLLSKCTDKNNTDVLRMMESSAELLLAIISDVLDLSKIESGRVELSVKSVNVRDVVSGNLQHYQLVANEKGLKLSLDLADDIPHQIHTDATRLSQILFNLVGNAVKFTEAGEIRVKVIRQPGQTLVIRVTDTGLGIDESVLEKVFKPFIQADGSITRRFGGSGLGLAISKQLAKLLGGDITVKSQRHQGSEFTLTLPIIHSATGSVGHASSEKPLRNSKKFNILVAEDSPANQMVIKLMLTSLGHSVDIVENGLMALDFVSAHQDELDVIFMDISMPKMDGLAATKALRQQGVGLPIIALTAHALNTDREQCFAAGMDKFVTKPIRAKDLQDVLLAYQ
uniref:histidine kinase n=2 Tax=Vibrio nigripulchritudo TaxID=28173 RepID=A0A9P1JLZ7_9VIBR|nr:Putative sensor protein [Vibrio nigripulchritudo]